MHTYDNLSWYFKSWKKWRPLYYTWWCSHEPSIWKYACVRTCMLQETFSSSTLKFYRASTGLEKWVTHLQEMQLPKSVSWNESFLIKKIMWSGCFLMYFIIYASFQVYKRLMIISFFTDEKSKVWIVYVINFPEDCTSVKQGARIQNPIYLLSLFFRFIMLPPTPSPCAELLKSSAS